MRFEHVLFLVAACGAPATPGARPHDMSVEGHETAARREDRDASEHLSNYDANARREHLDCTFTVPRSAICWSVAENPTEWQLRAAADHRRRAAQHRAASAALREAEERACVGIDEADRDISPFDRVEDIARVDALAKRDGTVVGALVTFHARPGMTVESLQQVVDCHVARSAVLGGAGMPDCPLAPSGLTVRVSTSPRGFVVALRAASPSVGREVLARARHSSRRAH
jgi:hypothetical protein